MKWQLLGSDHQTWLEENPNLVKGTSLESIDRAVELAREGELQQAIDFAGLGFEAAHIILQNHSGPIGGRVDIYVGSAMLLGNLLYEINQRSKAGAVVACAGFQLEALLALCVLRHEVLSRCLNDKPSDACRAALKLSLTR
ncbi:MAG: hypothetical protein ACI9WC_001635 [Arenicella sp.]|jgi:hypothetical protein